MVDILNRLAAGAGSGIYYTHVIQVTVNSCMASAYSRDHTYKRAGKYLSPLYTLEPGLVKWFRYTPKIVGSLGLSLVKQMIT